MSQETERGGLDPGDGADALHRSPGIEGPVDPPDDHDHANGHFALVYENREEQFASIVPFVRRGLERGEQCIYVVDDRSEEEAVIEALRDGGVDVDEALDSGSLAFYTVRETYLRTEPFDPEEMISFYADVVDEALDEYEAIRLISGASWVEEVPFEAFMEYEGRTNAVFDERDVKALCHYDRNELPKEVIHDVIRTHPQLIYDGTVCHNFYYTPPEELFDPDEPDREIDRMLGTVRDRARAKADLAEHKRFLRELNEITASPGRSFEEKLQALFDLGCEWFDLELGALNRVDPDADRLQVESISGDHEYYRPGAEFPLSQTYCTAAADIREAASVSDPIEEGFGDLAVYEEFGVEAYLGTYVPVENGVDRTLAFITSGRRAEPFSEENRTYLELMGQWVKYELDHRQYRRDLEETVDRLQQSNDRLKQFAYAASHDLQEPLRMVSSYLQLLENRYSDDLDEEAREYIDFAVDGADRMRAMVDDLLAFSRVEQSDGEFEPVDCEAVLDRVTDDLRVLIEEDDAEVTVESLPTVTGDREQLELLFGNLVSNAIKYNDSAPPRVEITAERRSDRWEFSVADDGIGIDPDKTDRIFEVFKRLHHDDEYPGTGIGLSLCQEIVENHGGTIRVESEPGEGSTFSFTLPRRTAE